MLNIFFFCKDNESWLWHRRIAHINMEQLNKLISKDLVIGLPKHRFEKDRLCDAYLVKSIPFKHVYFVPSLACPHFCVYVVKSRRTVISTGRCMFNLVVHCFIINISF